MDDDLSCPAGMERKLYAAIRKSFDRATARLSMSRARQSKTTERNRRLVQCERSILKDSLDSYSLHPELREALRQGNSTTGQILTALQQWTHTATGATADMQRKLDLVLKALSATSAAPAASSSLSEPAPLPTFAHSCVICQEGVHADDASSCFPLACCGQVLHQACVCALHAQSDDPKCPCCRNCLGEEAAAVCRRLWQRAAGAARRFVRLKSENSGFHSEYLGELTVTSATEGIVEHVEADLIDWAPAGSSIHAFVAKHLGGRWPVGGQTWVRFFTKDCMLGQVMRFEKFCFRYWNRSNTMRLSHGDIKELDLDEIDVELPAVTSITVLNQWTLETTSCIDRCNLGLARGKRCLVATAGHADSYVFLGGVDDPVGLRLLLRKNTLLRTIWAADVRDMKCPPWCDPPAYVSFYVFGNYGQGVRVGSSLKIATDRSAGVYVFHGWSRDGSDSYLECTSGPSFVRLAMRSVRSCEQVD